MPLNQEDEARGLKAYEQARAFERLRSWRLPLTYAVFALVPALTGIWMLLIGHKTMAGFNFLVTLILAWMGRFQWRQLSIRHARNLRLLASLKAEYGDQLPWIQVENHFAELEKFKRELAEKRNSDS
jgi:hypothetical protein